MLSNFGRMSKHNNCFVKGCFLCFFFLLPRKFKAHFSKVSAMEGLSDLTDSSDVIKHFEELNLLKSHKVVMVLCFL